MAQLLDFERELEPIEAEIANLRESREGASQEIIARVKALEDDARKRLRRIYGNLGAWEICQVARHPARPHTLDYIREMFGDFEELHGDRAFADDEAIVAGLAYFDGAPAAVIGHQKGGDTNDNIRRNFGMPRPEGYRKALRIMALAEKFALPVITFIDTPGAYPGIGAEERGQSGAIGENLRRMADLKTPLVTAVIGEGGSGGALALAAGDYVMMLQYAVYSVISPEGCASILWKDGERASEAAEILGLTAKRLRALRLIDEIVREPPGAAHRDPAAVFDALRTSLTAALSRLKKMSPDALIEERARRWRGYGVFIESAG
jgi:acetyl-CoA carboxylase carboxyl transferase subunit alpha